MKAIKFGLLVGSVTVMLVGAAGQLQAAPIFFTSRATFNSANPGLPLEDFEAANVASGNIVGFASGLNSATNNAVFFPGDILPGIEFRSSPAPAGLAVLGAGFSGTPSKELFVNSSIDSLDILFSPNVSAVGMDVFSEFNSGNVTVSVFGSAGLLGSTTVFGRNDGVPTFFGVASTDPIVRINLDDFDLSRTPGIDNVVFGTAAPAVPEPSSFCLALMGTVCFFGYGWRWRKQTKHPVQT